jgi:hypothetical protein
MLALHSALPASSQTSWPLLNLRLLRGLGPAGKNVFPFMLREVWLTVARLFSQNCRLRHLKCEYELDFLEVVNVLTCCPLRR